ncbi:hypothetical protein FEZ18_09160 [Oceanihabitans sp. IOP_32]|uniref:hypothetical protein n=1 Tax=Oceanihabitans sp. IOP_32 TaxID=2529032 RepID=UPI00129372FA|nr:hypothetical protein [Oceanihabitans sp. IOP_32]QFZ54955.1 hypothetical protein FEZ18_09160 [Oceanihabitans sp. IOP_32]
MNTTTTLLEKIENARDLDFGTIFGESIELFKKTWLQGFILVLLTMAIMIPLFFMLYLPLIGLIIAQSEGAGPEVFDTFFGSMSILYILFLVACFLVFGAISVAMNAGFYRMMRKLDNNEATTTTDLFYFVKNKYLGKAFMLMLASILIAVPSAFLCYVPLIYMIVPLSFFNVIFAFNPDLSVGDMIKVSFKLGHKKWLLAFGLIIVSVLLSQMVGYLLCGVGLLFTYTFVYHPVYLIYKNVVGFNEASAIEQIGESVE